MATISISKTELFSKLQAASKIISPKPVTPIMSCFHFHTHDHKLTITTADASGRIVLDTDKVVFSDEISICYESKMLLDALKTLPEQPITFEINKKNFDTTIKYQGGKFQMMGKSPELFPTHKEQAISKTFVMPSKFFLRAIEKVSFCAATNDLRPILTAVYLENKDGVLNVVSSDGHKMGLISFKIPDYTPELHPSLSFSLPPKISGVLKSILPKDETDICINLGTSNATLEYENCFISAQLLEGKFPNYNSVIPKGNDKQMTIPTSDLKSALSRVMVFTNQASQLVKFNLNESILTLTGQDIDFSVNAEERISCESTNAIQIGFKGTYLSELLAAIDSDQLVMTFSDPKMPALVLPESNEEGETLTYLLMPMMLNE